MQQTGKPAEFKADEHGVLLFHCHHHWKVDWEALWCVRRAVRCMSSLDPVFMVQHAKQLENTLWILLNPKVLTWFPAWKKPCWIQTLYGRNFYKLQNSVLLCLQLSPLWWMIERCKSGVYVLMAFWNHTYCLILKAEILGYLHGQHVDMFCDMIKKKGFVISHLIYLNSFLFLCIIQLPLLQFQLAFVFSINLVQNNIHKPYNKNVIP